MNDVAEASLWLLVVLPAAVGGPLGVARRADRIAVPVSLTTAALTMALSAVVAIERPTVAVPFLANTDFALTVDALAALIVPTVVAVTLLVLLFSAGEIRESRARFHGLMLLFASSAVLTATAATLPALLFAWEIMGAASYALIGFWWRDDERVSSGLTAFVTTRTADLGLYAAAAAALAGGAGLALVDLPDSGGGWRHLVAGGILVAALGKAAQLPFSFWLSRAMAGPSPVSALLHSAAMVAMGGYLLLRTAPLLASTGWAGPLTTWLGAATALLLGAVAVAQRDLKQLLAGSTAAQLGFVVMAAGAVSVSGGAAHLVAHASTKALLFLVSGAWLTALGTKQLAGLQGVARRWPLVGWSATVGALALAGIAPLSLWATKDSVLAALLDRSPWLYAVGLTASALSAAYAAKILVVIWRRVAPGWRAEVEADDDEGEQSRGDVNLVQQVPLVVLAAGAAVLGLLALPPVGETVAGAMDERFHVPPVELAVSAAVALVVVLAVARARVPEPRWAVRWLGLERAAQLLVVRPVLRLADTLARFDDRVLDRGVELISAASLRTAHRAAKADDTWLDGAVEWFATRLRRLGHLARRPQTGQLHQYYLQAVVVIAAGILLLVALR